MSFFSICDWFYYYCHVLPFYGMMGYEAPGVKNVRLGQLNNQS